MKSFVLMSKRSGELLEGYRMLFADNFLVSDFVVNDKPFNIGMWELGQFDGWIVNSPNAEAGMGQFWIWFNRDGAEKLFEVLGEL